MKTMIKTLWEDPASARKFIAALLGAIVVAVGVGLLPPVVGDWIAVIGAFLSALGVYAVHNSPLNRRAKK